MYNNNNFNNTNTSNNEVKKEVQNKVSEKKNKYVKIAEKLASEKAKDKKVNFSFKIESSKKELLDKFFDKLKEEDTKIDIGDFFSELIDWKQIEEYVR